MLLHFQTQRALGSHAIFQEAHTDPLAHYINQSKSDNVCVKIGEADAAPQGIIGIAEGPAQGSGQAWDLPEVTLYH